MRGAAFSGARRCRPVDKTRYCKLGSRACAVAPSPDLAAAALWTTVGTAAEETRMRAEAFVLCSLLPPGDQKAVLQPRSHACAVPLFRCARSCRPVDKRRYCWCGPAHARWRIFPCSLLPPRGTTSVLQLGSRACAIAVVWGFFLCSLLPLCAQKSALQLGRARSALLPFKISSSTSSFYALLNSFF